MRRRRNRHLDLSPTEMARLERRFRDKSLDSRAVEAELEVQESRRRRRLLRHVVLGVIAVAVIGSWLADRYGPHTPTPAPPPPIPWTAAPVFGDEAKPPEGCTEVADSGIPPLNGLADGSEAAQSAQLAVANEQKWPVEIVNSVGMHFRLVPHGSYIQGSPPNEKGRGPDEPETVSIIQQPFYMGKFEVTKAQWLAVMGPNSLPMPYEQGKRPDQPVVEVTWRECHAFAAKLSELEKLPSWAYRLPSEAEWEYACRAGTQTAYCFGDDSAQLGRYAVYMWNTTQGTDPVGQRLANAWGFFDFHGNVWEWCENRFYYYDKPDISDPLRRVMRGGHWHAEPSDCRSASRFRLPPDSRSNMLGFRLVRSIYKPPPEKKKPPAKW